MELREEIAPGTGKGTSGSFGSGFEAQGESGPLSELLIRSDGGHTECPYTAVPPMTFASLEI